MVVLLWLNHWHRLSVASNAERCCDWLVSCRIEVFGSCGCTGASSFGGDGRFLDAKMGFQGVVYCLFLFFGLLG